VDGANKKFMISEQKAKEYLKECNSKTEFAEKLGYSYYGGKSAREVNQIFDEYGLDSSDFDRGKKNRKYERVKKECPVCEKTFTTKKGHPKERKTCSHSCSNSYFKQGNSEKAKNKKSKSLQNYYKQNPSPNGGKSKEYVKDTCKVHSYKQCEVCDSLFVRAYGKEKEIGFGTERKTCSKGCKIEAQVGERTYQNGSRKPEYYHNGNTDTEVLLESSWEVEVAEKLDNLQIVWKRPDPIVWNDNEDCEHYYYPDFFLPNYNLYLDPKNPYCMDRDEEKMKKVSQKLDIKFGSLEKVIGVVNNLKN